MAKPTPMPAMVPSTQPIPIRIRDADTFCHSAPLTASCQIAFAIASGVGRNSELTRPAPPAACQTASTTRSAIQPPWRLARGAKPAPRKATGCVPACRSGSAERSSMLYLALGIDRFAADQRPQLVLQRQQLAAGLACAARGAVDGDRHDLPHPAGAARQHDDAVGEPNSLLEIVRDIDRAHRAVGEQANEILQQQLAGLRI